MTPSSHSADGRARTGFLILTRLTGLILTALAAQMVMTGIKSFFA